MLPRIFTSSKYQAAWVVTALATVSLYFTLTDVAVDRPAKQAAVERYLLAIAGAWGVSTAGTALEDYAKNRDTPAAGKPAAPAVQVNTGATSTNVQEAPAVTPAAEQPRQ